MALRWGGFKAAVNGFARGLGEGIDKADERQAELDRMKKQHTYNVKLAGVQSKHRIEEELASTERNKMALARAAVRLGIFETVEEAADEYESGVLKTLVSYHVTPQQYYAYDRNGNQTTLNPMNPQQMKEYQAANPDVIVTDRMFDAGKARQLWNAKNSSDRAKAGAGGGNTQTQQQGGNTGGKQTGVKPEFQQKPVPPAQPLPSTTELDGTAQQAQQKLAPAPKAAPVQTHKMGGAVKAPEVEKTIDVENFRL